MTHIRERNTPKEKLVRHRRQADLDLADIIDIVQRQTGINYVTVKHSVVQAFRTIQEEMRHGRTVYVDDFGTFEFKRMKERYIPNISKGNRKTFNPAHTVIKFVPETRWQNWQRINSMELPDQLPPDTDYGSRILRSREGRRVCGITTPRQEYDFQDVDFLENVILAKGQKRKQSDQNLSYTDSE